MTLIDVLAMPWAEPGDEFTRKTCAHGRLGLCKLCCRHGRRLDLDELLPCPGCPCPFTNEPHEWRDTTCADCNTVKGYR